MDGADRSNATERSDRWRGPARCRLATRRSRRPGCRYGYPWPRSGRAPTCPRQRPHGRWWRAVPAAAPSRSQPAAALPRGHRRRKPCARPRCVARGPAAGPRDRRRSSDAGCRAATGGALPAVGLRARQHQPVARRTGPPGAFHVEGCLPDAIHQAGIGRIQPVTTGQRPPRPGVEQHAMMPYQQRRALGAVQAERAYMPRGCRRARPRPPGGRHTSGRAPRHPPPPGSAAPAAG